MEFQPFESSWSEDAKIGIGFVSSSNTSQENQQNAFLNNPGRFSMVESVDSQ